MENCAYLHEKINFLNLNPRIYQAGAPAWGVGHCPARNRLPEPLAAERGDPDSSGPYTSLMIDWMGEGAREKRRYLLCMLPGWGGGC